MQTKDTFLAERADEACTMLRVIGAALERKLSTEFPQLMLSPRWPEFIGLFTVVGCQALAIRLHFDVELPLRTPLEERIQAGLQQCFPGSLEYYANAHQYVSDIMVRAPRDKRPYLVFPSLAIWLMAMLSEESAMQHDDSIVVFLAQFLQDETSNYWHRNAS